MPSIAQIVWIPIVMVLTLAGVGIVWWVQSVADWWSRDSSPIPESDPVPALTHWDDPWRADMTRMQDERDAVQDQLTRERQRLADLQREREAFFRMVRDMEPKILAFDRKRLLDDGVLGVKLSKRVH